MLIEVRRLHQLAAVLLIAASGYVLSAALSLEYYTSIGPGPGFFPFLVGAAILLLSGIWLVQITRDRSTALAEIVQPDWMGALRVLFVLGALVAFVLGVGTFGFVITMFAFLLLLIRGIGRHSWPLSLVISLGGSVGVFYLFHWLEVSLPRSQLPVSQLLPF